MDLLQRRCKESPKQHDGSPAARPGFDGGGAFRWIAIIVSAVGEHGFRDLVAVWGFGV